MKQPDFSQFPILSTQRFTLRPLSLEDTPVIYQLRSDPKVAHLTGREAIVRMDEATAYIKKIDGMISRNECILWGISYQNSKEMIGAICLWNFNIPNETVEIGYELLPEFHGKGVMSEVVPSVVKYGFRVMAAKSIIAFPSAENPASVKLLEKIGFNLTSNNYGHTHTEVTAMLTYVISSGF